MTATEMAPKYVRRSEFRRWLRRDGWVAHHPGCYAIVGNGIVYYIGQTRDIHVRLKQHGWEQTAAGVSTKKWGLIAGAEIKYRQSQPGTHEHLELEAKLVERLRPKFNVARFVVAKRRGSIPIKEMPLYVPKEGERLIPLAQLAEMWGERPDALRQFLAKNVTEALPEGIMEWAMSLSS